MTQQVPAQGRAYLALAPIENIDASEALVDALGEAYLAFGQEHPGQVMQPEPHTQSRIHIAVDFTSTRKRLQNHFMFVCCSLDGYSFSQASCMRPLGEY